MELTPNEEVRRVKAALAEAGYPQVSVTYDEDDGEVGVTMRAPAEVIWRALAIATPGVYCWPCWSHNQACGDGEPVVCEHDWRAEPQP